MHASAETLEILTAKELIEVNQDSGLNGKVQGRRLVAETSFELWVKHMADGKRMAALLINLNGVLPSVVRVLEIPPLGASLITPAPPRPTLPQTRSRPH